MNAMGPGLRMGLWALLAGLPLVAGCNILEWASSDDSFEALMADGREAIQAADYARAETSFGAAMERRPNSADARYHFAKAAVLNADVDVFSIVQTLTDTSPDAGADTGASAVFGLELSRANAVYRVNAIVLDALEPIRVGRTEGPFSDANVDLDLAVAYTLRGILRLRDTNGDGVIDAADASLDDYGLDDAGGFALDGLETIPAEALNDMITELNALLRSSRDLLLGVLGDSGVDVDALSALIDSLGGDLSAFYVNTGTPGNPGTGDNDHDGITDEECRNGIDDDGDGLIDEDSRVAGC